ncbi:MAG: polysaccharide biosynthesis tyrosine autokinase, partial [Actinobacteria bacterium]|nr:polysaccharide biosynthesis tyrosine autokinase [Actinomycetota bacterium]
MQTTDYLRVLKRSWVIITLALIAGALGGYWVYGHKTPMYRSSVQMVVNGSIGDEVASRLLAGERALALSQVAGTPPALEAAKKAAGYPSAAVSVTTGASGTSPFLTISVAGPSPAEAKAIADEFERTLPSTMVNLEGPSDSAIRVRNLASASLPGKPFSPSIVRIVGFGVAAGLGLGLVIALLREALDHTVRDSTDVDELTALPILGTVPRDLPRTLLPAMSSPRSARAEAYRQVRTTLINARQPPARTLAVTSASVGEGKTSVATNVAASFSRAGHRVAIVDADLRRPCVATFFGLKPDHGLTDVLAGTCSLGEALTLTDDDRLAVLTSGARPANPSEALSGAAMKQVLRELTDEYDYVIIDTPPVLPVSDPLVLAPLVDGVILVVQLGRTTSDRIKRATKALDRVGATILGVIPNKSGKGRDRDYRYPYRYTFTRNRYMRTRKIDASVPVPVGNGHNNGKVHAGGDQVPSAGNGSGRMSAAGVD